MDRKMNMEDWWNHHHHHHLSSVRPWWIYVK